MNVRVLKHVNFKEQETFLSSKINNIIGESNIIIIQLQKVCIAVQPHTRNGIILDPRSCFDLLRFWSHKNQPVFTYKKGTTELNNSIQYNHYI